MITKIAVKNFKSHKDTTILPGQVTSLVGPNGAGKTALLQAVSLVCNLVDSRNTTVFSGEMSPVVIVGGESNNFSIISSASDWEVNLSFSVNVQSRAWSVEVDVKKNEQPYQKIAVGAEQSVNFDKETVKAYGRAIYFKASFKKLSQPSPAEPIPPKLSLDGSGLASVIASMILSEPERLQVIEGELRRIVPAIKKVRAKQAVVTEEETVYSLAGNGFPVSRKRPNSQPGYELIFDTLSANSVPAYAMSEGTLLVLGLLTMLQEPSAPQVFLLDDIEQGLHPLAQRELMGTLKEFAKKQGRQIILTSHSPYIVDELEAKDVWVMAIDREGFSRAKRLSDHPDAKRLLSVLTTGEFVGAVGEDWVLGDAAPVEEVNA